MQSVHIPKSKIVKYVNDLLVTAVATFCGRCASWRVCERVYHSVSTDADKKY